MKINNVLKLALLATRIVKFLKKWFPLINSIFSLILIWMICFFNVSYKSIIFIVLFGFYCCINFLFIMFSGYRIFLKPPLSGRKQGYVQPEREIIVEDCDYE
jgi:hypothetical protein